MKRYECCPVWVWPLCWVDNHLSCRWGWLCRLHDRMLRCKK